MGRTIPIETISPIEEIRAENEELVEVKTKSEKNNEQSLASLFGCLLLFFLGAMLIFGLSQPYFVINPNTDNLDWGKLFLVSFISSLLVVIIIWIIFALMS